MTPVVLTTTEGQFLYAASLPNRRDYRRALGLTTREVDRMRQRLRKQGLVEYSGRPARWIATERGLASLGLGLPVDIPHPPA